jgi:protein MpaA
MDRAAVLASLTAPPYQVVGRSRQGRDIVARRFPAAGRPVLLFGAIHGDEPLGVHCLLRLAAELERRGEPPARDTWILPVANPDGFLVDRKDNAVGIDLNRNFPARNWSPSHAGRHDPGPAPASEPETQALIALIARIGARRLIALHSPFRVVNWDGAGRALAERMAARNGYGASGDIGYPTPGSFGSFYGGDHGCEVITLEIPPLDEDAAWLENRAALHEALDERLPA